MRLEKEPDKSLDGLLGGFRTALGWLFGWQQGSHTNKVTPMSPDALAYYYYIIFYMLDSDRLCPRVDGYLETFWRTFRTWFVAPGSGHCLRTPHPESRRPTVALLKTQQP